MKKTDKTVKSINLESICAECRKKPPIQAVQCLHQKNIGNDLHSSKIRKQLSTATTGIGRIMREAFGVMDLEETAFFDKRGIARVFNRNTNMWREAGKKKPKFHLLCMDPNAGGMLFCVCFNRR